MLRTTNALLALVLTATSTYALDISGDYTTDVTLDEGVHNLNGQVYMLSGTTLTIAAGATIKAAVGVIPAPAIVIEQGAKIIAEGSRGKPITMTSKAADADGFVWDRGLWGGLIVLGKATINTGTGTEGGEPSTKLVEGLPEGRGVYGGNDDDDNSGILKFVRVWYGGAAVDQCIKDADGNCIAAGVNQDNKGNEINGITLGGVGRKTVLEDCEVAFNVDDGFEFFGGAVNGKRLSVIFGGDDSFDTDQGYKGKLQFLFTLMGAAGDKCCEMDSIKKTAHAAWTPRSFPQIYGATFIGGGMDNKRGAAMMNVREGTGGHFANIIFTHPSVGSKSVLAHSHCGEGDALEKYTQDLASVKGTEPNYQFWSPKNIAYDNFGGQGWTESVAIHGSGCGADGANRIQPMMVDKKDPLLRNLPDSMTKYKWASADVPADDKSPNKGKAGFQMIDPRPEKDGEAYKSWIATPEGDDFWDKAEYAGAFGEDLWLVGMSWLDDNGMLPANEWIETYASGELTSDTTWKGKVAMTADVIVAKGATLTIEAGTVVKVLGNNKDGTPPTLMVAPGGKIAATGTWEAPILVTTAMEEGSKAFPVGNEKGAWGGIVLAGEAPINGGNADGAKVHPKFSSVEYGGLKKSSDSGTLSYVQISYGGLKNGDFDTACLELAGTGTKTVINHVETAACKGVGVKAAGTTDLRGVSTIHSATGLQLTDGYVGKVHQHFALGKDGMVGMHIGSEAGMEPVTAPTVSGVTLVGASLKADGESAGAVHNALVLGADVTVGSTAFTDASNTCTGTTTGGTAKSADPGLATSTADMLKDGTTIDPRPTAGGAATKDVADPGDDFFAMKSARGAFAPGDGYGDFWLKGLSFLETHLDLLPTLDWSAGPPKEDDPKEDDHKDHDHEEDKDEEAGEAEAESDEAGAAPALSAALGLGLAVLGLGLSASA